MADPAAPHLLPPVAVITDTDKGGVALIVTALGLAFAFVSVLIRIYVRYEFSPNRFRWDDAIIGVSFLFSIFQSATIIVEVHHGFGKIKDDISSKDLVAIQKGIYANDILWIISLWLSKISLAALFLRLSPQHSHVLVSRLNILLAILTGVAAIFLVSLRCNLSHPWININAHNAQCSGLFARWQTIAAFDISSEILLFAASVFLIYSLQMRLLKKSMISMAFALRLPVIIPAAFHVHYIYKTFNSSDSTLEGVYALACRQSELAWAITAATIPCLRPFITATATNYGAPAEGPRTRTGTYAVHGSHQSGSKLSRSRSNRNPLASLSSKLRSNKQPKSSSLPGDSVFEDQYVSNRAEASRHAGSIESGESQQQMIILKNISYKVEPEE